MELGVDRYRDEAGPPYAEQRLEIFGVVSGDDGDTIARREPVAFPEAGSEPGGPARERS